MEARRINPAAQPQRDTCLKEVANRIQKLSYTDMRTLQEMMRKRVNGPVVPIADLPDALIAVCAQILEEKTNG